MIITLKKANFSSNNIGTLSTWSISRNLGSGIENYNGVSSVDKGASFTATMTLKDGYDLGTVTVTMGGSAVSGAYSVSGSTITISISPVTGNVYISVSTVNMNTGEEDSGGNNDTSNTSIIAKGTNVASMMPQNGGYVTSTNGQVMEYSGYDWENYDIYVSCRYGTTTAMYAACVWGANDTYLGGIWQSTGTAKIFTEELLEESDLPEGVTWSDVEKIGLSWSTGKNTPEMKLVPKA